MPAGRSLTLTGTVALVLLLTAFLVVTQLRTERRIQQTLGVPSTQLRELGYRLWRLEAARRALEQEVESLRTGVASARRASVEAQTGLLALNAELEVLAMQVGVTALQGPGVMVEIRDSARPLVAGEDPNDALIHYTDLQALTNELWAAGAEALAINGERFTVGSSIQCVGTTVLVNRRRIAPPFRIAAIGDPVALEAYLDRSSGQVAYLRAFGFPATVRRDDSVQVPPYRGPVPAARALH